MAMLLDCFESFKFLAFLRTFIFESVSLMVTLIDLGFCLASDLIPRWAISYNTALKPSPTKPVPISWSIFFTLYFFILLLCFLPSLFTFRKAVLPGWWSEFIFRATGRFVHTLTRHWTPTFMIRGFLLQSCSWSCYCHLYQFERGIYQLVPKSCLLGHCLDSWWSLMYNIMTSRHWWCQVSISITKLRGQNSVTIILQNTKHHNYYINLTEPSSYSHNNIYDQLVH